MLQVGSAAPCACLDEPVVVRSRSDEQAGILPFGLPLLPVNQDKRMGATDMLPAASGKLRVDSYFLAVDSYFLRVGFVTPNLPLLLNFEEARLIATFPWVKMPPAPRTLTSAREVLPAEDDSHQRGNKN
jgi:hypothetical protein